MKIVEFSIRRPVTVTMVFLAIAVFGVVSYGRLPLNLLPDISYPTLTVQTTFEGAAPAEIESLITKPVENAVSVVDNVVRVSSVSKPEVSEVIVEFSWQTQMDFAALDIRERIDVLRLPQGAEKPILLRYDPSTEPIMRVAVTGASTLAAGRYLAEEFVKPDLESIEGIAAVRVSGGLEEEIYVELDEQKLSGFGISISDITNRFGQENINLTGGRLREGESQYMVRTLNEFQTLQEMDEVIVTVSDGVPVRLSDVGRVVSGYKERTVITRLDGEEAIELAVFKAADANTVLAAALVRERLLGLAAEYEGKRDALQFETVFDQSSFIQQSIDEVLNTAMIGGVLAVVVLLIFLRSIKSTLIIALSIPLSIVATFFLMYGFSVSLNIMSLSGLALGIGMLVDNSIVVLESIYRHRRKGLGVREAADRGASEVGQAVIASTMTTVCVFLPIVFVEGIAGQLFADQALTVTFSLGASLLVAIMLIPMLSSRGNGRGKAASEEKRFFLVPLYSLILNGALRARVVAVGLAVFLLAGAASFLGTLGGELIPDISQGEFLIDFQLAPGTPLEETSRRIGEVEVALSGYPEILTLYAIIGAGSQSGVSAIEEREHIGQTLVRLQPGFLHEREAEVMDRMRRGLQALPAIEYKFSRPTLFSFKTAVEVIVEGYNLNALKLYAERLRDEMARIDGLRDLKASTEGGNPEIHIEFDRRKLAAYGLNINQAASQIRNKVQGDVATEFTDRDRKIDIRVRLFEEDRDSVIGLERMVLSSATGPIQLSTVARVVLEEGPPEIRRIGPQRAAVITANLVGRDLQSAVEDIESILADFRLPGDFDAFVAGQSEERAVAFESMRFAILLAVFLVYLVMASQFESLVQPFIIMFAIPFALIGVAVALGVTAQAMNVVVLIGFVVLAGIVVNNSIVLIDYTNQLRRKGLDKFEAVRQAGSVRLRPILMTTATTMLGLLPMAISWGEGAELRVPLAVTVIGGLLSSTLLTLVLVPVMYTIVVREKQV